MFEFISRFFGGVSTATATPDPVEGERYILHESSPFPNDAITCVVTGVLNGWVRYAHLDQATGKPYNLRYLGQSDAPIRSFLSVWKRLP